MSTLRKLGSSTTAATSGGSKGKVIETTNDPSVVTKSQDRLGHSDRLYMAVGWVLTLLMWTHFIILCSCVNRGETTGESTSCNSSYYDSADHLVFWTAWTIVTLLYLVFVVCCPVRRYLACAHADPRPIASYLNSLHEGPAKLRFYMRCYHFETEMEKGSESAVPKDHHVNTHVASQEWSYDACDDVSETLYIPRRTNLIRLRLEKSYDFADAGTEQSFMSAKDAFIAANKRDDCQQFDVQFDVPGFEDYVMSIRDESQKPWFLGQSVFLVASLMMLAMPYHHWFYGITTGMDHKVQKRLTRRSL